MGNKRKLSILAKYIIVMHWGVTVKDERVSGTGSTTSWNAGNTYWSGLYVVCEQTLHCNITESGYILYIL